MATKKQATTIEIKPMEFATVEFTIAGTAPLIMHAWSEKAKRMMLDKQQKKATKAKHDVKIPVNDFIDSMYWLTEKPEHGETDEEAEANYRAAISKGAKFGFPLNGIKMSFIQGARRAGLDVVMTELYGAFFVKGSTEASTFDLAEVIYDGEPEMREDNVMVGGMSKTADIRYRGMLSSWRIPLTMTYNVNGKYSLEQLLACVTAGGFQCGIGEWRVEKKGQFGMYELVTK